MKKILFIIGLLVLSCNSFAEIGAVTETGDEVVLFEDGTWIYRDEKLRQKQEIVLNDIIFSKSDESTFLVKSNRLNIGVWIDPKKWSFSKTDTADASEFSFKLKDEDLYGMLISEKIEIPLETLKDVAIHNAESVSTYFRVSKQEYRNVNGIQVLMLEMIATIENIDFVYYGYYFSNSNGSVQLLTYTSNNLKDNYLTDIEALLNGITEF